MDFHKHTRLIFVGSKLLMSPLEALFGLLVFIFVKDLNASPLQIALLVTSKPLVALLSFYGNLFIKDRPHHLKSMIIWSTIIGSAPCLLFPFVDNIWFYLFAFALFMMSARAMIPAWSEIFKINLEKERRGKVFSQGSVTNYLMSIIIPIVIAPWIDIYPQIWKWLFFFFAFLQSINIFLILCIHIKSYQFDLNLYHSYTFTSLRSLIFGPWSNCLLLMKNRPDFRSFQIVFMLGGGGLMLMHPILPIFFKQTLQLSYTELTLATSFCKGVAFALTSSIWAYWFDRISIHFFNSLVTLFAGIFAFIVIAAGYNVGWLYIAYLVYGIMQAGSELSWNLSGPIFSKEKDSTLFTGVNVAMVGLRGIIAPFIGEVVFLYTNDPNYVFFLGAVLCLCGSIFSTWVCRSQESLKLRID